jgi:serine/threonine-protein kinase RsbW
MATVAQPAEKVKRSRRMELRIQSDPANLAAVRKAVEEFAAGCKLDEKSAGEVGLCVNERLANIIRHAYAGRTDRPIHIEFVGCDGQIQVRIRDWGNGVDPSTIPQEPYDPLKPGGVGLICLRELMDQVVYIPLPDGMLTIMDKRSVV